MGLLGTLVHADSSIPLWFKGNAEWWADGLMGDDDFIQGVKFLVEEGIVSTDTNTNTIPDEFPPNLKNDVRNWVDGLIDDGEFILELEKWIEESNSSSRQQTSMDCDDNFEKTVSIKKPTKNFNYQIHVSYGPEQVSQGCEMQWLIKFLSKYDDTEFLNQVQYDFLVVDENLTPLRSIAQEENRDFLYSPSGQAILDIVVKEEPGDVNYVIWVYGLAPEGIVPSTASDYLEVTIPILSAPTSSNPEFTSQCSVSSITLNKPTYFVDEFAFINLVASNANSNPTARDDVFFDILANGEEFGGGRLTETKSNSGIFYLWWKPFT